MTALASLPVFAWLIALALGLTGIFSVVLIIMLIRDWASDRLW